MKATKFAKKMTCRDLITRTMALSMITSLSFPMQVHAWPWGKKKELDSNAPSFNNSNKNEARRVFTQKAEQCVDEAFYSLSDEQKANLAKILNIRDSKMDASRVKVGKVSYYRPFSDSRDMSLLRAIFSGKDSKRVDQYSKKNLCVVSAPVIGKNHLICQLMLDEPQMQTGALVDSSREDGAQRYKDFLLGPKDLNNSDLCNTHPQMLHIRNEIQSMASSGDANAVLAKDGIVPPPEEYGQQEAPADNRVATTSVRDTGKRMQVGRTGSAGRANVGSGGGLGTRANAASVGGGRGAPPDPAAPQLDGGADPAPGTDPADVDSPDSDEQGGQTGAAPATTAGTKPPAGSMGGKMIGNLNDALGILSTNDSKSQLQVDPDKMNKGQYSALVYSYRWKDRQQPRGALIPADSFNAISLKAVELGEKIKGIDSAQFFTEGGAAEIAKLVEGDAVKEAQAVKPENLNAEIVENKMRINEASRILTALTIQAEDAKKAGKDPSKYFANAKKIQAAITFFELKQDAMMKLKAGAKPAETTSTDQADSDGASTPQTTDSGSVGKTSGSGSSTGTGSAPKDGQSGSSDGETPSNGGKKPWVNPGTAPSGTFPDTTPGSKQSGGNGPASTPGHGNKASTASVPAPSPVPSSEMDSRQLFLSDLTIAGLHDGMKDHTISEAADRAILKAIANDTSEESKKLTDAIAQRDTEIAKKEAEIAGYPVNEGSRATIETAKKDLASLKYERQKLVDKKSELDAAAQKVSLQQEKDVDAMLNVVLESEKAAVLGEARRIFGTNKDGNAIKDYKEAHDRIKDAQNWPSTASKKAELEGLSEYVNSIDMREKRYQFYLELIKKKRTSQTTTSPQS